MLGIMLNIWGFALSENHHVVKQFSNTFMFTTITSAVKLVISCLINGLVHEESDRISAVLDNMDARDLDESEYKEWLMFKNISRKAKFGFTIGGFAALRKSTLVPV